MVEAGIRGRTAVVGIGQTPFYRRRVSPDPEVKLALRAIVEACEDAGIHPSDVDGFVSYGSDNNDVDKLVSSLGTRDVRLSALVWGGGGGGIPGALALGASAIVTGQANVVAVYRAMAEAEGGRFRVAVSQDHFDAQSTVNGLDGPLQGVALWTQRLLEVEGIPPSTLRAIARVAYYHAQRNPRAVGRTTALTDEDYEASRWVSEPFRLFDCSRENDCGIAVLLVSAERAKDVKQKPAYLLSAPLGGGVAKEGPYRHHRGYYGAVPRRLWAESGYSPADVDVAQVYENFSGAAVSGIIEHGFCTPEEAGEFIAFENLIAPHGRLPVNTAGGNIAEGNLHGMGLVAEAVRQVRGESPNQVPNAKLSLMIGGPSSVSSSALFGAEETL